MTDLPAGANKASRRTLLRAGLGAGLAVGAGALLPGQKHGARATTPVPTRGPRRDLLRVGVCADPHKDLVHDCDERLRVFIEHMRRERVDRILQLGDFCVPEEKNDRFLTLWRRFDGPRHHVVGNHDMDGGHTVEQAVAYWNMPGRYHSFDAGGFHFVTLDTNDPPVGEERSGYPAGVRPDQVAWLKKDLASTRLPTVVLSHQPLGRKCVRNRDEVLAVLRRAKDPETGRRKVVACLAGHFHVDDHIVIDGIHHVIVNSMSYLWVGRRYAHLRYSEAVCEAYPATRFTAPYLDALYTIMTFDPEGSISMTGLDSEWVGPSPFELGMPRDTVLAKADAIVPKIRARTLEFVPPR